MIEQNFGHANKSTPPQRLLPVLQLLKHVYLFWFDCYGKLPKTHRYSIGKRIDDLFVETIETIIAAAFLKPGDKLPYVKVAIRKCDTIKYLLLILFETNSLEQKRYIALSDPLDEIGRMLGGWHGQLQKQNSPNETSGEK